MYIRLKKKPSIFINVDRFEFLEQIIRTGNGTQNIFTMKSLILAQDER